MEIRELNKDDIESLLELYVQLDESSRSLTVERSSEVWEKEIQDSSSIKYFGAVEDGKVIATCYCVIMPNLTHDGKSICFIENVVTDEKHRKQGLAKAVIAEAEKFARASNCYKMILESNVKRTEAHKFYEHIGFDGGLKKAFDKRL